MIRRALLAALAMPALARAQELPSRPVRLVIAYSAGGVADTIARSIQPRLAESLGQSVIVENRTGASGAVGAAAVAHAPADGHTLLLEGATLITSPLVNRSLPLDYGTLQPVGQVTAQPYFLAVRADFPAEDLAGFIGHARRNPGAVTFGTPGVAHIGHLMGELMQHLAGIRMEHIPYRGGADVARDLAGGRIDSCFISLSSLLPVLQAGRGRLIGVTSATRRTQRPDVPAISEALPGYELMTWTIIFAPGGTPAPVVARVAEAVRFATSDGPTRARLDGIGNDPVVGSTAEAAALVMRDRATITRLIEQAGLRAAT